MKIVTYNVNGLRARLSSVKSLRAFLDSFDADIICIQETKTARQELTTDLAVADGYESFFSCTRTVKKGRVGYSGVATFCRTIHSTDVSLPTEAEEGFTGILDADNNKSWLGCYESPLNIPGFSGQELLELDCEGRCIATDHGHFVLFNIYGPCAGSDNMERQEFKLKFYKLLQSRLEELLRAGRRIIIVGDLNISPFAIDSCDPGPHFEDNPSRKWLRTMLTSGNGSFSDVFRAFHPERNEAYTCWSQASGAEEFNYGTRIDLILVAGPCTTTERFQECAGFSDCGVESCDILHSFRRTKPDTIPRWAGGRSLKLEGSDHAPVFVKLRALPPLPAHNVPKLAARFMPGLRGRQQSLFSVFEKVATSQAFECRPGSKVRKLSQSNLRSFCVQKQQVEIQEPNQLPENQITQGNEPEDAKTKAASEEWGRLKLLMASKTPFCKGHGEPCVVRLVKKPGPNNGRGFYVCARGKGPSTNPEARCDHFEWTSKVRK